MTIDPKRLKEWARLANEATSGPWKTNIKQYHDEWGVWQIDTPSSPHIIRSLIDAKPSDLEFIVAAREAVPALIEALVEERARANWAEAQIGDEAPFNGSLNELSSDEQNEEKQKARRELGLE